MRSFCPNCNRTLEWYELIPVLSFFIGGGKCATCSQRISRTYPVVEFVAAALTVLLFLRFGATARFLFTVTFVLIMLLVAIVDWRHFLISNKILGLSFVLGVILFLAFNVNNLPQHLLSGVLAFGTMLTVTTMGKWIFRKEAMGFGDVKLGAVIGLFLGFQNFLLAVWMAAVLGALFGIFKRVHQSSIFNLKSQINLPSLEIKLPFGTFMAITSSVVCIFEEYVHEAIDLWLALMQ